MKPRVLLVAVVWVFLIAPCSADVEAQAIALNCVSCHSQTKERLDSLIPGFDGVSLQQLQQALLDFKYDRRQASLMPRIAKGYSDEELISVAAYLVNR